MEIKVNEKTVKIPDSVIDNYCKKLQLTKDEAVELYLEENGILLNEEFEELDAKAKKVKISKDARAESTKERKPRTVKISNEKQELFNFILEKLDNRYNVKVTKENKLFEIELNGKIFKLDLIEQRNHPKG